MGVWESYSKRMALSGGQRQMWIDRTQSLIDRKIRNSPSCHEVLINGISQTVSITHRQNMAEKRICAMPGEHLKHGGIVDFANNKWLISEVDADNEVYERGLMLQCNHKLRWIGKDGNLKEKWCVVEDGTKYLIGEYSEAIMAIGDARIALTICKDKDTLELSRGMRFLIDDPDSESTIAYQITKPNKLFNIYNGEGVFKFILTEVNLTDADNVALRIADYANWTPPKELDGDHMDSEYTVGQIVSQARQEATVTPSDKKEVWL